MNHISDDILELYVLNDRKLSRIDRAEIFNHLKACTECRAIADYFSDLWSRSMKLSCSDVTTEDESDLYKTMVLAAATATADNTQLAHLSNCYSNDYHWSIQFFENKADDSVLVYVVSDEPQDDRPLLLRISGIEKNIFLDSNRSAQLEKTDLEHIEDWTTVNAWITKPTGSATFEDVHMIEQNGKKLFINTLRNKTQLAILKNPRKPLQWIKRESPGVFSLGLEEWTPDSTVWFYE